MAYNPKKQVQRILWAMKKSASRVRTASDKKKYIEAKAKKMDANPTGLEYAFIELLNELKIKFETQKILQGKIYDFFIPEKNTIIEVDGDYWHVYNIPLNEMNHIQKKPIIMIREKILLQKVLDII